MQFDNLNDLGCYPRILQIDYRKLKYCGIDMIFAPSVKEMYPQEFKKHAFVEEHKLLFLLEGSKRPNYFRGINYYS